MGRDICQEVGKGRGRQSRCDGRCREMRGAQHRAFGKVVDSSAGIEGPVPGKARPRVEKKLGADRPASGTGSWGRAHRGRRSWRPVSSNLGDGLRRHRGHRGPEESQRDRTGAGRKQHGRRGRKKKKARWAPEAETCGKVRVVRNSPVMSRCAGQVGRKVLGERGEKEGHNELKGPIGLPGGQRNLNLEMGPR